MATTKKKAPAKGGAQTKKATPAKAKAKKVAKFKAGKELSSAVNK